MLQSDIVAIGECEKARSPQEKLKGIGNMKSERKENAKKGTQTKQV